MRKVSTTLLATCVMLLTLATSAQAAWHVNGVPAPIPGTEYTLMGTVHENVSTVYRVTCEMTASGELTATGLVLSNVGFDRCLDQSNPKCTEEEREFLTTVPPKGRHTEAWPGTIVETSGERYLSMPYLKVWLVDSCNSVEEEATMASSAIRETNGSKNALKPSHFSGLAHLLGYPLAEASLEVSAAITTPTIQLVTWE